MGQAPHAISVDLDLADSIARLRAISALERATLADYDGSMEQVPKQYTKPPIVEAIIDIRVRGVPQMDAADIESRFSDMRPQFPSGKVIRQAAVNLDGTAYPLKVSAAEQCTGIMFSSTDGKTSFSARNDGFSFHRLAPYPGWSELRSAAKELWQQYCRAVSLPSIARVALRYLNRIDLPGPISDVGKYLANSPQVAAGTPGELAGYFMQLALAQKDIGCIAIINQAMIPPVIPGTTAVLVDIEVSMDEPILPQDADRLWGVIETLRERKNALFESGITASARELFK